MFGNSTAIRFLFYAWIALSTFFIVALDTLLLVEPFTDAYDLNASQDLRPFILVGSLLALWLGVRICEEAFVAYFRILKRLWDFSFDFQRKWVLWGFRTLKFFVWQILFWVSVLAIPAISLTLYSIVVAF